MIAGVILAAGSSVRMGTHKSLLRIGEKTFLQHIVDVLHSARVLEIVVVLGAEANRIKSSLGWFKGRIVVNKKWKSGQLTSIIAGIDTLDSNDVHGAMILPVDHPLISHSLLVDLLQAFWKSNKNIVVPVYRGKRGHPVIFSTMMFDVLRAAPLDIGARAVLRNNPEEIIEVKTEEKEVVININTLEDYTEKILRRKL